jgi:hypothetical protein
MEVEIIDTNKILSPSVSRCFSKLCLAKVQAKDTDSASKNEAFFSLAKS